MRFVLMAGMCGAGLAGCVNLKGFEGPAVDIYVVVDQVPAGGEVYTMVYCSSLLGSEYFSSAYAYGDPEIGPIMGDEDTEYAADARTVHAVPIAEGDLSSCRISYTVSVPDGEGGYVQNSSGLTVDWPPDFDVLLVQIGPETDEDLGDPGAWQATTAPNIGEF